MKKEYNKWDLTLLYKNEKDPRIEKDMQKIEKLCESFEKKYKKTNFTETPVKLSKTLADYEKLSEELSTSKPWWYFALRKDLNGEDSTAQASSTKFQQRMTLAGNRITFFTLVLGKIPKNKQKLFLKKLPEYAYFLEHIFETAKYDMSEKEEQLKD